MDTFGGELSVVAFLRLGKFPAFGLFLWDERVSVQFGDALIAGVCQYAGSFLEAHFRVFEQLEVVAFAFAACGAEDAFAAFIDNDLPLQRVPFFLP